MKKLLSLVFLVLVGCGNFQPRMGMDYTEFKMMSPKSYSAVNISRQEGLAVYATTDVNRELSKQGNWVAKSLYDPNLDFVYVFDKKTNRLTDIVPINQIDRVYALQADMQRNGFVNKEDYLFAKSISANASQLQKFKALGIENQADYIAVRDKQSAVSSLYANKTDAGAVLLFLQDSEDAKLYKITLEQMVKKRQLKEEQKRKEDEKIAAEQRKEAAIRAAALDEKRKMMSFMVAFQCVDIYDTGTDLALGETLIDTLANQDKWVFVKLITSNQVAKFCEVTYSRFNNLKLLRSNGRLYEKNGDAEYYLVRINGVTFGVVGR